MAEPDYRGRAAAGIAAHQRSPGGGYLTWAQRVAPHLLLNFQPFAS